MNTSTKTVLAIFVALSSLVPTEAMANRGFNVSVNVAVSRRPCPDFIAAQGLGAGIPMPLPRPMPPFAQQGGFNPIAAGIGINGMHAMPGSFDPGYGPQHGGRFYGGGCHHKKKCRKMCRKRFRHFSLCRSSGCGGKGFRFNLNIAFGGKRKFGCRGRC